jgi:hypothetical protein
LVDFFEALEEMSESTIDIKNLSPRAQQDIIEEFKGDNRLQTIDLIWSGHTQASCCLAVMAGWEYGICSANEICRYAENSSSKYPHAPVFVDNPYERYDHETHLAEVKKYHPRYATVRDMMTQEQCAEADIEYFSFEQILDWGEELREYTDNVILIPKYDVLDKIPDHFMLGYSIPTSYGGTPIDIKRFKGRRVHLLGGSPNKQIAYLSHIPDSVVSLDNNYIQHAAAKGRMWLTNGMFVSLRELGLRDKGIPPEEIGFGRLNNVMNICLAISLTSFATYFRRQYVNQIELLKELEEANSGE